MFERSDIFTPEQVQLLCGGTLPPLQEEGLTWADVGIFVLEGNAFQPYEDGVAALNPDNILPHTSIPVVAGDLAKAVQLLDCTAQAADCGVFLQMTKSQDGIAVTSRLSKSGMLRRFDSVAQALKDHFNGFMFGW